jgi:monofunctional biosynthetic peptidoglycan transglycosylase
MKKILRWIKYVFICFFSISILSVLIFRFLPVPFTPLMLIRVTEQIFRHETVRLHNTWKPLDEISPNMPLAVMISEDQRFTDHWGFDFKAIQKVLKTNGKKGIKGASTISQQTAKNLFLWPGRSWLRKGLEVYFTVLIEITWSKKRILEVYLNIIEMGDGIYGAEAASQIYFKHAANNLTFKEAALIAAVLPNPLRWSPQHPTPYIRAKQYWIIRNIYKVKTTISFSESKLFLEGVTLTKVHTYSSLLWRGLQFFIVELPSLFGSNNCKLGDVKS